MNRGEAIERFLDMTKAVAVEWGVGRDSQRIEAQETREALRALGVTDAEIDEAEKD